ncbi:hypothetical protein [Enterobacter roggenkampii]|uniref:hypothetical protein n=1 Tax=Enterobacter roggenkampii TaxID=1812935 RepID=UPI00107E6AB2|nr:hypothetical protein [Enterobacter roggenkampii]QBX83408.1 hypothetical protein E4005_00500 [Enterobacter roggenkampii]
MKNMQPTEERIEKARGLHRRPRQHACSSRFDTDVDVVLAEYGDRLSELEAVQKLIDEQREVMRRAAGDISYAIFNPVSS